ncbi:hypothetical protein [Nonlabens ulvanivorans]|uniref:SIR2-like domain-containing protein n=1 Tax=Nonlabens ulvanivorans TaxID=906888 RepID=A0A084JXZ8_NONUL|nr:hypothetical protein [Nonlabens ulvanivorans]KEZ93832.1 hypothetical protein IL45_06450 [Nonlabens ulvanivorans]PRX14439.1 hypothetical protein LY02_01469 [Nonlabens ulvanivorans]
MKKAKKITYLFGAGASYNAVPILNSLSESMRSVVVFLKTEVRKPNSRNRNFKEADWWLKDYATAVNLFSDDLYELALKSDEYGTIDTYAKKLELNNEHQELKKMKFLVSIFFTIWQGYFYKSHILKQDESSRIKYSDIDIRYKSLVSNYLLKTQNSFPTLDSNVNFVSWNYDHQLESAFSLFFKNKLNLTELNDQIKFLPTSENVYSNNKILHLNGISNFWINNNKKLERIFQDDDELEIKTIIKRIAQLYKPSNFGKSASLINYAWDNNLSKLKDAKRIFQETDILIIIGYSFPTFNREIDAQLLIGNNNKFEKIVYQDPNASKELLSVFDLDIEATRNIYKEKKEPIILQNTDQFHIPAEYFPSAIRENDNTITF